MHVLFHPDQQLHNPTQPHMFGGELLPPAENATRAQRLLGALEGHRVRAPEPIDPAVLRLVHDDAYLRFLETAHARWREATGGPADGEAGAYIRPIPGIPWKAPTHVFAEMGVYSNDVDPILEGTWPAALASASSAIGAADLVTGGASAAYALCRPPGHHAAPATYGGYCYLNNTALAAARLANGGAKVAIVDIDAHHGNGTQAIFWDRGDVLTTSIHGDPSVHFPFYTGFADERGEGPGAGRNVNAPLPSQSDWAAYEAAVETVLDAVDNHDPDFLVIALGVDTHRSDLVLALEGGDYQRLGERLAEPAIPTVLIQEGGYGEGVLETAVPAVLGAFD